MEKPKKYLERLNNELFYGNISYGDIKKERIKTSSIEDQDYIVTQKIDRAFVGLGEIQGMRDKQEDSLSAHLAYSFDLLSENIQKKILSDTFSNMINHHSAPLSGST